MTSTTAEIMVERDAADRQRRLATAVKTLRTRAGGSDGARTLLIAGGVLLPLGFILILLGWYGAAHTVNVYEQIPYSISGGTLGLGLVFAGGFSYFAYWLTQMVYAARRDAADTRDALHRIEQLLAASASASVAAAAPSGTARRQVRTAGAVAGGATFFATPTGTMFHRADCPAVAGRDNLREVSGTESGLTACRICEPVPGA